MSSFCCCIYCLKIIDAIKIYLDLKKFTHLPPTLKATWNGIIHWPSDNILLPSAVRCLPDMKAGIDSTEVEPYFFKLFFYHSFIWLPIWGQKANIKK